jgi:bifunctional UDP-N-acetylglucosamine pyrophosphorylase/glucosamine-1-phosphate N-acetyltransferase
LRVSESRPATVIILAAGEGKRMKSRIPKVLHGLCGRSMLGHTIAAALELDPRQLVVVTGHGRELVTPAVTQEAPGARVVVQEPQLGTGHAVRMVSEAVGSFTGTVVVTYGDMPLLRAVTLRDLVTAHHEAGNAVTVLTARGDARGYGRIVRDDTGAFTKIVEEKDATPDEKKIDEYNSGCYAFDGALLTDVIKRVTAHNAQQEEYLTDAVAILRGDGHPVGTVEAADNTEILGINDRVQLAAARRVLNARVLDDHMRNGVTIIDPASTWIDVTVTVGQDAEIRPQVQLEGATTIGESAKIGPGVVLTDTAVGADAEIINAVARNAEIGAEATVGPYAYLRPGARIGRSAHIGCHVELKNSTVGTGAKVPHLTYVGDADIGERANIGAGTIFANYDGVAKHHTTVGDDAFVGSNTVLVAPLEVGGGAYTAAGSAISEDVPPGALGIARGRQHNSTGWVMSRRAGTRSAATAATLAGGDAIIRSEKEAEKNKGELFQVSGMTAASQKKLMLFGGRAYPELATEVAECMGIETAPARLYDFANGEIMVRFLESVRGCDAFVLQSHTAPINQWIMEQLIMVDALKRASAKRITVVMPFFGYARQDKKSRGREPISARLVADLFATAGADRLMAVDLHTAQIQGFFDGPVDHLFALPILAGYLETKLNVSNVTVVAPDAGRVRVCERWTDRLGTPLAIIHKRRDPEVANQVKVFEVVGEVKGRTCILVDDMIDTGGTIAKAADALFEQGAERVIVAATHGVLSGKAIDTLKNSRISEVVITNTLPVPEDKLFDKLTVLSIAPLLARAIHEVFHDGSVTSLFDGQS